MRGPRTHVLFGGLAFVALTSYVIWSERSMRAAVATLRAQRATEHTNDECAATAPIVAPAAAVVPVGPPPVDRPVAATTAAEPAPKSVPRMVVTAEARRDALDARFYGENRDPSWSRATEAALARDVARSLPTQSQVRSIECRDAMCRVESSHGDSETYREFVDRALMAPDVWRGPVMATILQRESNGGIVSVAFLGRDAQSLRLTDDDL
jgi:hypothetical protein